MSTAEYERDLVTVLESADLGDCVHVDRTNMGWMTPYGPVSVTAVKDGDLLNVGPVIMVRWSTTLEILGELGTPPLPTKLRFDDQKRLYITVSADNGEWTWRLLRSDYVSAIDDLPVLVGRWPD